MNFSSRCLSSSITNSTAVLSLVRRLTACQRTRAQPAFVGKTTRKTRKLGPLQSVKVRCRYLIYVKVKVKVEHLVWYSAPSKHGIEWHRGLVWVNVVHGAHQAASHVPALYLPSCSRYSFTDPERIEGWVSPSPGCKEQLAHGCYTTASSQRTRTPRSLVERANH